MCIRDSLNAGQTIENLKKELKARKRELDEACGKLTDIRKKAAEQLAEKIKSELAELGMDKALFSIQMNQKPPSQDLSLIHI